MHRLRFQTMRTATSTPSWLEAQGGLLRPQRLAHRRRWHPHHSRALAVAVEDAEDQVADAEAAERRRAREAKFSSGGGGSYAEYMAKRGGGGA